MYRQIQVLAKQLDVSDAQLLILAREVAQDDGLRSIDYLIADEQRELVNLLWRIAAGPRMVSVDWTALAA